MPATADPHQAWTGSWRAASHCGRWWGATRSRNQRRHGADPQRGSRAALPQRVAASSPLADRSRHGEVGVVIVGVLGPLLRQQWCLDPRPRACHGFCRVCGLPPGITVKNVADSTIYYHGLVRVDRVGVSLGRRERDCPEPLQVDTTWSRVLFTRIGTCPDLRREHVRRYCRLRDPGVPGCISAPVFRT